MSARTSLLVGLLLAGLAAAGVAVSPQLKFGQTALSPPAASHAPEAAASGGNDIAFDLATFRRIASAQTPMVVNIRSEARRQTRRLSDFFGAPTDPPRGEFLEGAGSGFIIDKGGLIITNNHVVAGATRIEVGLFAGTPGLEESETYDAEVIGRDVLTDSALIRLVKKPSFDLPVATLGDSRQMQAGDWVVAIGNPFGLGHTVTVGVISAKERPFAAIEGRPQAMLQSDAAINPGNSGGPLLNVRGEVIGVNTAIISPASGAGNVGIGFAIPISVIKELLPQLHQGKVTRGRIGVQVTAIPRDAIDELGLPDRRGALVAAVDPSGPAAQAGVQPGDVIVEYQGQPVAQSDDLLTMVSNTPPGTVAAMRVLRDKRQVTMRLRIAELNLEDLRPSPAGPPPR